MVEKFSCFHPTPSLVFSIAHSSFSFIVDFNSEIYCIVSFVFLHTLFNDILEQNRLVFVGDACSTRDIFFPPFFSSCNRWITYFLFGSFLLLLSFFPFFPFSFCSTLVVVLYPYVTTFVRWDEKERGRMRMFFSWFCNGKRWNRPAYSHMDLLKVR